jgi:hypothetical protein
MRPSRILLISILCAGVFYVGSFVALGNGFPTINSTGQEVVEWFTANDTKARIYAWCSAFICLGLCIFGGQVAGIMPRPNGHIFLAGIVGAAITAQIQAWFWAGLAFQPQDLEPATARTIFAIASYWGPLVNGSMTVMAAAVAALGFGPAPIVPRWLTWLSVIFFVEQAIETVTVFGQTGFLAPGGTMNVYLGGVIGFAWVGGVAHWAMGRLDASGHTAEAEA